MARRKRKANPGNPLAVKTAGLGDVKWHKDEQKHSWTCDNCGETIKADPSMYNRRLNTSQWAMEHHTKVIWGKAMDHVRRNCSPEPRPAYRKDIDG